MTATTVKTKEATKSSKAKKCRHCRTRAITRPRLLCRVCHDEPDVRNRYPRLDYKRGESTSPPCRLCLVRSGGAARGLCRTCHRNPQVRQSLGIQPQSLRDIDESLGRNLAECEPTRALPGTEEKVKVLEARYAAGQRLWHPEDGRIAP